MKGNNANAHSNKCVASGGRNMTESPSNVDFSSHKPATSDDTTAGQLLQQAAPALVVRLPGVTEHLIERCDRDRARWLGHHFNRPATTSERAFLAASGALADPSASPRLQTRVDVRGGVRRRTWPMLAGIL
ncbi:hypothetical protein ACXDF8_26325 [Mycolicibacterium sp. CBM1]